MNLPTIYGSYVVFLQHFYMFKCSKCNYWSMVQALSEKLSKLKKNNFFLIFKIHKRFLNNAYLKKKPQINGVSLKEKINIA